MNLLPTAGQDVVVGRPLLQDRVVAVHGFEQPPVLLLPDVRADEFAPVFAPATLLLVVNPAIGALKFFARGRVDLAGEHVDLLKLSEGVPGAFFEHLVRVAHAGEITCSVDRILYFVGRELVPQVVG